MRAPCGSTALYYMRAPCGPAARPLSTICARPAALRPYLSVICARPAALRLGRSLLYARALRPCGPISLLYARALRPCGSAAFYYVALALRLAPQEDQEPRSPYIAQRFLVRVSRVLLFVFPIDDVGFGIAVAAPSVVKG
jgi:hypothetical protein